MIRASVFYSGGPDARFDFDYYLRAHVPLAKKLFGPAGMVRLEVDRGLSGEERGQRPRFICIVHVCFETEEAYYAAMAEHGETLGADVPNFTDAQLEIQVSEVLA